MCVAVGFPYAGVRESGRRNFKREEFKFNRHMTSAPGCRHEYEHTSVETYGGQTNVFAC